MNGVGLNDAVISVLLGAPPKLVTDGFAVIHSLQSLFFIQLSHLPAFPGTPKGLTRREDLEQRLQKRRNLRHIKGEGKPS